MVEKIILEGGSRFLAGPPPSNHGAFPTFTDLPSACSPAPPLPAPLLPLFRPDELGPENHGSRDPAATAPGSAHARRKMLRRLCLHVRRPALLSARALSGDKGTISVDRSGLKRPVPPLLSEAEPAAAGLVTPLAQELSQLIELRGGIPVADWMHYCLLHPKYGYYSAKPGDQIGRSGDFVTSPELTSMFGELLGVWFISMWQKLGAPGRFQLVEVGPGKGTLISDAIRTADVLPAFRDGMQVHLVEPSRSLRAKQRETLALDHGTRAPQSADGAEGDGASITLRNGTEVHWHDALAEVPEGPTFVVAHELLDALPVHQFVYTEAGWRERLVTQAGEGAPEDFVLVAAERETPALSLLRGAAGVDFADGERPEAGAVVEVCPGAMAFAQDCAARVRAHGGAALLVDYGGMGMPVESVRGFRDHREVSWLSSPGLTDVTADVDFSAVGRCVEAVEGVAPVGPVEQGAFLGAMGIKERTIALLEADGTTEQQQEALYKAFERLVSPEQMGSRYKVMAIVPEAVSREVPGISPALGS